MVAYSFRPRFVEPILSGQKTQTIRAPRKRHARPGEELQLYTGMRTARCSLIRRATCLSDDPVRLRFDKNDVTTPGNFVTGILLDAFARRDGFGDWSDMRAFWREEHGDMDRFEGVLIRWAP